MCRFRTYSTNLGLFFNLLIFFSTHTKCDENKSTIRSVDVHKTRVYGPGLNPDKIVLPVRYFYIQAFDAYGHP